MNVYSLGLSHANEEQQVYSAIWDMPTGTYATRGVYKYRVHFTQYMKCFVFVCAGGREVQAPHHDVPLHAHIVNSVTRSGRRLAGMPHTMHTDSTRTSHRREPETHSHMPCMQQHRPTTALRAPDEVLE